MIDGFEYSEMLRDYAEGERHRSLAAIKAALARTGLLLAWLSSGLWLFWLMY